MKKLLVVFMMVGMLLTLGGCAEEDKDDMTVWALDLGTQEVDVTIPADGEHYYRFVAPADADYDIELTGLGSDLDWILMPYISNDSSDYLPGDAIAWGMNYEDTTSETDTVSLTAGTYLIIVMELDGMNSYYDLMVRYSIP